MRIAIASSLMLFALPLRAEPPGADDAPAPAVAAPCAPTVPARPPRTVGGHTFMTPATLESPWVETTFGNRLSARYETIPDVPIGNNAVTINSLGVREEVDFEAAFADRWAAGISVFGQFATGITGTAIATQGALFTYGATVSGAFRILRDDSSATQLTVRAELFGVQGGGRISLGTFLKTLRNTAVRDIPDLISNFGDFLITPASSYGGGLSLNLGQALTPALSLQGSVRLELRHLKQSPFVPGEGRVDNVTTAWLPQGGVAFGVEPPGFPFAFLAEYRFATRDENDLLAAAHHLVAVSAYYAGRPDLQLGPVLFGEFGLPHLTGIDADGNAVGSANGTAVSFQLVMRYFW
jgi:hypothetical protein